MQKRDYYVTVVNPFNNAPKPLAGRFSYVRQRKYPTARTANQHQIPTGCEPETVYLNVNGGRAEIRLLCARNLLDQWNAIVWYNSIVLLMTISIDNVTIFTLSLSFLQISYFINIFKIFTVYLSQISQKHFLSNNLCNDIVILRWNIFIMLGIIILT